MTSQMNIWYCCECGDYSFSEPSTPKDERGRLQQCSLCRTMSVVPIHRLSDNHTLYDDDDGSLGAFVKGMKQEFPDLVFDDLRPVYRPLNYLIQSLNRTKHFIHIATESIDSYFLGMLSTKYFQSDIEIHVIVWHPQNIYRNLKRLIEHSIFVKGYQHGLRPMARGITIDTISEVHQKLYILDGITAFYGSANASLAGWTRPGEIIKFTDDIDEVSNLNRTFFSPFLIKKHGLINTEHQR